MFRFLILLATFTILSSCSTKSFEESITPKDSDRFGTPPDSDPAPTPPNAPTGIALAASFVTGASPISSPSITWTNPSGDYKNVQVTLGTSQGDTDFVYWTNVVKGLTAYSFSNLSPVECTNYYPTIRSIDDDNLPSSSVTTSSNFYWDNTSPVLSGSIYISSFIASSTTTVTVNLSSLSKTDNCQLSHLEFAIGYDDDLDGFDSGDIENVQSYIEASGGSSITSYQLQNGVDSASFTLVNDRDYYITVRLRDNANLLSSAVVSSQAWRINDLNLSSAGNSRLSWVNGSGGGGKVVDGGDGSTNAGAAGIGNNDSIIMSSYDDIIFADGSGGGGGTGFTIGNTGGAGGAAGAGNDFIVAGDGNDIVFADGFTGSTGGSDKNAIGGDGGYGGGGGGGSSPVVSSVGLGGIGAGNGGGGNSGIETDQPTPATDATYGGGTAGATPAQSYGPGGGGVSTSDAGNDGDGAGDGTSAETGNTTPLTIDLSITALYTQILNDVTQGGGADGRLFSQTQGSGNDTIVGGNGDDYIFLGNGTDTLIYNDSNDGTDEVFNFTAGASQDQIELRNILSNYTQGVSNLADYITVSDNGTDTTIEIDLDGTGGGTTTITIVLKNTITDYSTLVTNNITII